MLLLSDDLLRAAPSPLCPSVDFTLQFVASSLLIAMHALGTDREGQDGKCSAVMPHAKCRHLARASDSAMIRPTFPVAASLAPRMRMNGMSVARHRDLEWHSTHAL